MQNEHEKVEKPICRKLVAAALANGWTISVYDGEEWPVKRSTDKTAILAAMFSTDMDRLMFRTPDGERVGHVDLIYGNGADVISDNADVEPINALLEPVQRYADSFY